MPVDVRQVDPDHPDPEIIRECAEEILRGACVSFPTDTFYGLGCSLMDAAAVEMVYRLKRRPEGLAVISLIGDPTSVEALALDIPDIARPLMQRYWPGPLSIVFRASPVVPERCRGPNDTIALRCPGRPIPRMLLEAVRGPVVATSADVSGEPPARSAQEVAATFGNQLAMVLDGGPSTSDLPSTLVDVTGNRIEVLREGAIDLSEEIARRT